MILSLTDKFTWTNLKKKLFIRGKVKCWNFVTRTESKIGFLDEIKRWVEVRGMRSTTRGVE